MQKLSKNVNKLFCREYITLLNSDACHLDELLKFSPPHDLFDADDEISAPSRIGQCSARTKYLHTKFK
jgi:hypothetical protein